MLSRRRAGVCASATTRGMRTGPAVGVVTVGDGAVVGVVAVGVVDAVPAETLTVTCAPLSTSFPAGGFWATTIPAGLSEGAFRRTGWSPSFVNVATALPCVLPTMRGTT